MPSGRYLWVLFGTFALFILDRNEDICHKSSACVLEQLQEYFHRWAIVRLFGLMLWDAGA